MPTVLNRPNRANRLAGSSESRTVPKPKKEADQSRYSGRLAKRLRTLREAAAISPDDLAAKLTKAGYPVSSPTLYAWERGSIQVQLDALPYLARAFRVPVAELMPEK